MTTAVLITRHADNRYSARALALSDVVASGASEAEAIAALRTALAELQAHSHIVQVDVPLPAVSSDDPWLRTAGIWANDPSWDAFRLSPFAFPLPTACPLASTPEYCPGCRPGA
jgi:predicted RNase H-like HicB family nuclease